MLISFIVQLVNIYTMIIFVYVLMSWIPIRSGWFGTIYSVLGRICDPYLNLFRRFIPPIGGMVDVSPIVALLVLQFAVRIIIWLV